MNYFYPILSKNVNNCTSNFVELQITFKKSWRLLPSSLTLVHHLSECQLSFVNDPFKVYIFRKYQSKCNICICHCFKLLQWV